MAEPRSPAGQIDRRQARSAFERAVGTYDASAVLQREIAQRLLARLELIKLVPRRILDLGCGTGYCTRALARRYRRSEIVAADVAYAMTAAARRRRRWFSRQRFLCADAEALPLRDDSIDMLVSNLTLQWCDPDAVLRECARVLRPGGVLMLSSFGPDTLRELRAAWRAVDEQPHVHTFVDMHDLGDALMRAGFAGPVMDVEHFTLSYPEVLALLRDLKDLGAHNVARSRHRGLTGKGRFARFKSAYESQAGDGRICASYEVVYGHAWAPARSPIRAPGGGVSVAIRPDQIARERR